MIRKRKQVQVLLMALMVFWLYPHPGFSEEEKDQEGHQPCSLCHEMEGEKALKVKIKPDTKTINPYTGRIYGPVDGVCISCHPQFTHAEGHPLGITPVKVKVPAKFMGYKGQEKELTCLACHNPHPHQTKYKFLRLQTPDHDGIKWLCSHCHIGQAPR